MSFAKSSVHVLFGAQHSCSKNQMVSGALINTLILCTFHVWVLVIVECLVLVVEITLMGYLPFVL